MTLRNKLLYFTEEIWDPLPKALGPDGDEKMLSDIGNYLYRHTERKCKSFILHILHTLVVLDVLNLHRLIQNTCLSYIGCLRCIEFT